MFFKYKLKKGEDFKSVMRKHKIKDWAGVWNLKGNASLRKKRKYADKVTEGDTLIIWDGRIKYHKVVLDGNTYMIPEKEWPATKKKIIADMNTKLLMPLFKMKKIYDDEYLYLSSLADDNAIAGFFAALVENTTNARVPLKEMNAATVALRDLQKKILAGKFADVPAAGQKAQNAIDNYVKASETYRCKMTNGATKGVKVVKFVDDYAFIVAGALATGGASAVVGGAFTAVEIAAAVGAGTALVKGAGNEIGRKVAGDERGFEEIAFTLYAKMVVGGAEGALVGKLLSGKMATAFFKEFSRILSKSFPNIVRAVLKDEVAALLKAPSLMTAIGKEKMIEEAVKIVARTSANTMKVHAKKIFSQDEGIMVTAVKAALKKITGRESEDKLATLVARELASGKAAQAVARSVIKGNRKAIIKELEKIEVDA